MRLSPQRKQPVAAELRPLWETVVPGSRAHCFAASPQSASVFVSGGWGVAHPALRVHQLDAITGVERRALSTRHQAVNSMVVHGASLWVATDRRLFHVLAADLSVTEQWDKGLVTYPHQLAVREGLVVMANWRGPTVGILDPATGRMRRRKAGEQPVLVSTDEHVEVLTAVEPGRWVVDEAKASLRSLTVPASSVVDAAYCGGVWVVTGGRLEVDRQGESATSTRQPSNVLLELETGRQVELAAPCTALTADVQRGLLWAVLGEERDRLVAVDVARAAVVGTFSCPGGSAFEHVAPACDVALARTTLFGDDASVMTALALPEP